jgi:hypothetical protein
VTSRSAVLGHGSIRREKALRVSCGCAPLIQPPSRGPEDVLAVSGINGQAEDRLACEPRRAVCRRLSDPRVPTIVTTNRANSAVGGERIDNPELENLVRVPFSGTDIHATRVSLVDGNGPTGQARTGEIRGIYIKPVHSRMPTGAPIVRSKHPATGAGSIDNWSAGGNREAGHPPADRLTPDGLTVEDDRRAQWQPVPCAGNEGSCGADDGGLPLFVFGEPFEPNRWSRLRQHGFASPWLEAARERVVHSM